MSNAEAQAHETSIKQRAIGLFKFLKEIVQLRSVVVRDAKEFIDVLWLTDLPQEDGCYCAGWSQHKDAEDNVWVEIKKQSLPKVPQTPEICSEWIQKASLLNPDGEPQLLESISNPDWQPEKPVQNELLVQTPINQETKEVPQFIFLSEFPDVSSTWQEYVERKWKPWSQEFKRKKVVQDIYSKLFSMYQQQKALGESYEVVLGLGVLYWKTPKDQRVARHIVSAQINLDFNPNQGTLFVRPSIDGARLQFEQDMLEPDERPHWETQQQLEDRLKEISNQIWHNELMHSVLRSWVQALHANGSYSDQWQEQREFVAAPKVSFSPALILRKRSTRGYIKFIEDILKQIESEAARIPDTVRLYIDMAETSEASVKKSVYDGMEPSEESPKGEIPNHELYFPLPTNDEQRDIVHKLDNHLGVLVQGPPGTGKSHTIANLICHLLADGKRVLVTSQTPRALKVLMGKLPAKISPLCVNLLGRGLADVQSMERSVGEINQRYNTWNLNQAKVTIKKLETELYQTKKRLQEISFRMQELREAEIRKYSVADGLYKGTAQQIAQQIANDEAGLGWMQDEVSAEAEQPFGVRNLQRFLELKREFTDVKIQDIKKTYIPSKDIPSSEVFVDMLRNREQANQKAKNVNDQLDGQHLINTLKKADKSQREKAIELLNKFRFTKKDLLKRPLAWLPEAVIQILGEQDKPLKELEGCTRTAIEGLKEKARVADETDTKWLADTDLIKLKADAEDLCDHLRKGGNLGWAMFKPKVVQRTFYITKQVHVDGRICEKADSLEKLIACLGVEIRIRRLDEFWKDKIDSPKGARFHRTAVYAEQHEALLALLVLEDMAKAVTDAISNLEGIAPPKLYDEKETEILFMALDSVRAIDASRETELEFERLLKQITLAVAAPNHHPLLGRLLEGLQNGNWNYWAEGWNALCEVEKLLLDYQELVAFEEKLKEVMPNTVGEMCENIINLEWDKKIESFDLAWKWSRADAWLTEYSNQHDEYELQNDYSYQQKKLFQLKEEIASEKAWAHCFARMTEAQRQHLMAWSVAIKKLGKGTGKHAEKHRRDAEANLRECQAAIPAWIMPLYRVVDTVKAEEGIFDVVIIDEASQCGSEALLLQYIAKQCIIVGDEEQIAPEAVGIERNQVHLLIDRFLKDVPIKESFDVESSLFTHAKIRYKNKIVLREHFRCVPEIIQFSNNLCYAPHGASLIPLRQYPPDRLEPIKTVHVPEGFREGFGQDVINKPEADKIVEAIVACHKDKKYQGKSFGVISLQGHNQSRYIEKRLVEELGPEAIEARNLICGEAYDFQGDERHVIFISLVAATNERIGPLSKETDKRRFNVAASRAADQVWLFHSVTLEDLSSIDLRYQLLNYYLNPQVQPLPIDGIDFDFLRKSKRDRKPPEPFDSWFEVDVFMKLCDRGYRVIPQYRVANYKIDLVVEGIRGRLAVECDGDEWHGPDMYEQDMKRQRILERSKWSFWRVRGSSYYRDSEQALEPLWQKLDELGIHSKSYKPKEEEKVKPQSGFNNAAYESAEATADQADEKADDLFNETLEIASQKDLATFSQREDNAKRLSPEISRAAVIKILTDEPSKGKDLLPNDAIKLLGYTCRRDDRKRLERKIQRAITDLMRVGKLEEYATNKRKRVRLNDNKSNL